MDKKVLLIAALVAASVFAFSTSYTVLNVDVAGNTYVASSDILSNVLLQAGKSYDENSIKSLLLESAKKVMRMGYFSNVVPKVEKGILPNTINITFKVKENPVVKKVEFNGITLIKKATAEASSLIKIGEPLNINLLRETLQNIFSLYRKAGYSFSVDIETNVSETSTGISLPKSVLKINVREYALYDVLFKGEIVGSLKSMEDLVTFKTVKKIEKEATFFKTIDSLSGIKGYVKDDDIITLRYKLMNTGYYSDVSISKSLITKKIKGYPYLYNLIITLKENKFIKGNQEIKNVVLNGVKLVNKDFLKSYLLSKVSSKTSVKNVADLINDIKTFYKDRNYIGIDVVSNYDADTKTLTFNVFERKIRDIRYSGDVILKKILLDKTLRFHSGQPLKLSAYISTTRNLQMTGYFEKVNIVPTPVATNNYLMDIVVYLKAKKALGNFSGGIAWGLDQSKINDIYNSTPDKWKAFWEVVFEGISANMKIKKSNLTGIGDDGSLTLILGPVKKNVSLGYKVNWINGSNFSPNFSIFYNNDYDTNTPEASDLKEAYGFGLNTGYTINDYNSVNFGFNIDHYKIYTSPATIIKEGIEGSILFGYTFDGRDNPLFPRNGIKLSLNNETKFLDFQEFDYNKTKTSASIFWEPLFNWILASNLSAGYIYPITTTETAFVVGGSNSVRGWGTSDFPSVSGPRMIQFNLELRHKLDNGMVLIPAFFDIAHAGGKTISSVGAGVGVAVPMFGTIQIGVAYPLTENSNINYYVGFGGIF
jgi:outer membrane protein insertion porin family